MLLLFWTSVSCFAGPIDRLDSRHRREALHARSVIGTCDTRHSYPSEHVWFRL